MIVSLGVIIVGYLVLLVFLGIYGYNNADPSHAYFVPGVDKPALTRPAAISLAESAGVAVRAGYPTDFAHLFRVWFLWGFWGSLVFVTGMTIFVPLLYCLPDQQSGCFQMVGGILCLISSCSGLIWVIMGAFWRFSAAGKIVSGEKIVRPSSMTSNTEWNEYLREQAEQNGYQIKSGRFMYLFVWVFLFSLMAFLAIGSVVNTYRCAMGQPKDNGSRSIP